MNIPNTLKYTSSHEWCKIDGNIATVGLSDYAQSELGDIVFLSLPAIGTEIKAGGTLLTIEAVKTVADMYSPVSGKIVDANTALDSDPQKINQDCYGDGWVVKVEMSDPSEVGKLMDASVYETTLH
ncbi:MAG: glycine cleavage system protein GcvH [bacterium]|nr:glycine cleavage system protein GcvH [bacterium]